MSEQTAFGASITRRGSEPPAAVSVHGWRYHHIGIPTNVPRTPAGGCGSQLQKVLEFRAGLEASRELLFNRFDSLPAFETRLRYQLGEWRRRHRDLR